VFQLEDLVAKSATSRWQETLAILSTYGQSDEFPALCIALGDRLEAVGGARNASLCYLCSLSLVHSVKYWRAQLEAANQVCLLLPCQQRGINGRFHRALFLIMDR
jgi:protein transport protein SEC31